MLICVGSARDSGASVALFADPRLLGPAQASHIRQQTSRSDVSSPMLTHAGDDDILNTEWERILYEVGDDGDVRYQKSDRKRDSDV